MPFKSDQEVFDAEPALPKKITEKTKRVSGGLVRIWDSWRKIATDKEHEDRRKKILEDDLPDPPK